MTLKNLIQKAEEVGKRFSSAEIPLKYEGSDVDIEFREVGSNDTVYVINVLIIEK